MFPRISIKFLGTMWRYILYKSKYRINITNRWLGSEKYLLTILTNGGISEGMYKRFRNWCELKLFFFSFHLDINECAERKMCKSNEKCINIEGSFRCEAPQCPSGKRLSPDGTRCEGAYHLEYLPIPRSR